MHQNKTRQINGLKKKTPPSLDPQTQLASDLIAILREAHVDILHLSSWKHIWGTTFRIEALNNCCKLTWVTNVPLFCLHIYVPWIQSLPMRHGTDFFCTWNRIVAILLRLTCFYWGLTIQELKSSNIISIMVNVCLPQFTRGKRKAGLENMLLWYCFWRI